jgi:hypothetical protein
MMRANKGAQICNLQPKKVLEKSQNETKSLTLTKNKIVTLESNRELRSEVPASSLRRNSERPRVRVTGSRTRGGRRGIRFTCLSKNSDPEHLRSKKEGMGSIQHESMKNR